MHITEPRQDTMTTITQSDLIESVAAALQYISYYHPADYIAHLARAYEREQSPAAKDAIAQILTNSKMSATGHRPICQDTGIVNVFLKVGMGVRFEGFAGGLDDAINEGVRRAYNHPTTACVPAWSPTRSSPAKTPATTRLPSSSPNWYPATPWK
jgi:tartrate dehydratase alpha subunit/fumarate hydratase class I-like protein